MKVTIEARIEAEGIAKRSVNARVAIAVIHRHDDAIEDIGLTLAEGNELLGALQRRLFEAHTSAWLATHERCVHCRQPSKRARKSVGYAAS